MTHRLYQSKRSKSIKIFNLLISTVLRTSLNLQLLQLWEYDVLEVLNAGVLADLPRWAECALDLGLDVSLCVLDEDRPRRVGFGHFLLSLNESHHHV